MNSNAARLQPEAQNDAVQLSRARDRVMQRIVAKAQMEAVAVAAEMAKAANSDWAPKEAATSHARASAPAARRRIDWEPVWRVLAVAMAFELGWWTWVALQVHQPQLALPSAFEAEAVMLTKHDAADRPAMPNPAPAAAAVAMDAFAPSAPVETPNVVAQPPQSPAPLVDVTKLRLATSLDTSVLERRGRILDPQ